MPALLVMSVDFDAFSPRADPWLLIHFGEAAYGGPGGLARLSATARAIAQAATEADEDDLYAVVRAMTLEQPDMARIFEFKPGMFGFSIDVVQAGQQLIAWLASRRRRAMGPAPS